MIDLSFTVSENSKWFIEVNGREFFILYDDFIEVFTRVSKEFDNVTLTDVSYTYEAEHEWLETICKTEIIIKYDPVYTKSLINFLDKVNTIVRIIVTNCFEFNKVTSRENVKKMLETPIREFCKIKRFG